MLINAIFILLSGLFLALLLCLCYGPLQSFTLGILWRRRHGLKPGALLEYRGQRGSLKEQNWWGINVEWSKGTHSWLSYRQLEGINIEIISEQNYLETSTFNFETLLHYTQTELLGALAPLLNDHPQILSSPPWTLQLQELSNQKQQQWTLKICLLPTSDQQEIHSWLWSIITHATSPLQQRDTALPPLPQ